MKYVLFLRGINVGGKNKVSMSELKQFLQEIGFRDILTYINSGNICFTTDFEVDKINLLLKNLFSKKYTFNLKYSLISQIDYTNEFENLPTWWSDDIERKDVLFFGEDIDKEKALKYIENMRLADDEKVYIGDIAIFWAKYSEKNFLNTAYHKQLIKSPIYKEVTIRNAKTVYKMLNILS